MELILERIAKRKTYTIGHLYIQRRMDDEYLAGTENQYFCDTLEPTWRDYEHGAYKVKGRSAIPEGRYAVVISWSPKMKPNRQRNNLKMMCVYDSFANISPLILWIIIIIRWVVLWNWLWFKLTSIISLRTQVVAVKEIWIARIFFFTFY